MCGLAMGLAPGRPSPWASRGVRKVRFGESISQETMFLSFPILIVVQIYLSLAVRRPKCVEIELLGLWFSLAIGHRVGLAIEKSLS